MFINNIVPLIKAFSDNVFCSEINPGKATAYQ